MRRMTIISVAFPFAVLSSDPVGGAEQVLACLDRALIAAGHRSIVVAAEGSTPAGELVSVPQPRDGHIGWAEWDRAHSYLRQLLPNVIRMSHADLVHMHGVDFHFYLPPRGVPVLATLHMPLEAYAPDMLEPQRPRTWFNTVSRQHAPMTANPRFVAAIENGIDIAAAGPAHRERRFAVAMGRICPEKGFHLALDAAKAAGVPFRLAGQVFPYAEHQRYFAEEIKPRLDSLRRWIGPVSGARKWQLLQSALCLLAPSLIPETASLVAREALAAGTPVIAYPSGALADMIEPGLTGFLVHTAGEIAAALLRISELQPEACRRVARERYSAEQMSREYLQLYERLVQA